MIIGGGDGGIARELDRYSSVKEVVLCEIDEVLTTYDWSCALSYYSLLVEWLHVLRELTRQERYCRVGVVLILFGQVWCADKNYDRGAWETDQCLPTTLELH